MCNQPRSAADEAAAWAPGARTAGDDEPDLQEKMRANARDYAYNQTWLGFKMRERPPRPDADDDADSPDEDDDTCACSCEPPA